MVIQGGFSPTPCCFLFLSVHLSPREGGWRARVHPAEEEEEKDEEEVEGEGEEEERGGGHISLICSMALRGPGASMLWHSNKLPHPWAVHANC